MQEPIIVQVRQPRHRQARRSRRRPVFWGNILCLVVLLAVAAVGIRNLCTGRAAWPTGWFTAQRSSLDEETMGLLRGLAAQDGRVQTVIDHQNDYPSDILKMLAKNEDMLDFVLEYPAKKGKVYAETVGEVESGKYPLLLQYDQRWGYGAYGSSTVVVSGCGPACLSMVVAGLTGDNGNTPYEIAQYANEHGYYVSGKGTKWTLMSEGAAHFGVTGKELPLSRGVIEGALSQGKPVICCMKPGDFTTTGHFILITGTIDGQFTVNDPNSVQRSARLWDYETLEPQISNLWAFERT